MVCLATLLLSGLVGRASDEYRGRVAAFFTRLATPVPEEDKPVESPGFRRSLANLFAIVFAGVGVLYLVMSLPSIAQLSGRLAVVVGLLCLATAALLALYARKQATAGLVPG
ncbi:MAG: hypothetical protein KY464_15755 [Gemmatimonadetes bacterium]|nr:hypothetical protein [Gemmatimonadota bacterium]